MIKTPKLSSIEKSREFKNMIYDDILKFFRLNNMYNFDLFELIDDIKNIDDASKIYITKELTTLVNLKFFDKNVNMFIKQNYLNKNSVKALSEKINIKVILDELISVEYDINYQPYNLRLNTDKFWFFSPKRFCTEFTDKLSTINTLENKRRSIENVINTLKYCIDKNMISCDNLHDTLCWIDYYECLNK